MITNKSIGIVISRNIFSDRCDIIDVFFSPEQILAVINRGTKREKKIHLCRSARSFTVSISLLLPLSPSIDPSSRFEARHFVN